MATNFPKVVQHLVVSVALLCCLSFTTAGALQCYSCRGSASNEVEANINCLEKAYLEDCDDFYTYYSDVEDQNVLSYEYYYYEPEEEKPPVADDTAGKKARGKPRDRNATGKSRGPRRRQNQSRDQQQQQRPKRERAKRQVPRGRHVGGTDLDDSAEINRFGAANDHPDYDYYSYGDYNYTYDQLEQIIPPSDDPDVGVESSDEDEHVFDITDTDKQDKTVDESGEVKKKVESKESKLSLPKDPEHYCYSKTKKSGWESYTVEKGCKKIAYCNELIANNPEWGNPWNFCCEKTRCNAKLVKDKPQRIFGMGCRQTDDCIQGINSRPICPAWFQSCPKISSSMIKMECRAKSRTNKHKYHYAFKEKKCYCSSGYYPKGPICAKGRSSVVRSGFAAIVLGILAANVLKF